jgi:glycosyltransferase involved in cell wall biosynthesis
MSRENSSTDKYLVSIVMSVYNNVQYIDKAVLSILSETHTNFEFIIIDDCSTDGSREKLQSYAVEDDRIRLILNEQNLGLTKNLNRGLSLAMGEFTARMDGDDYSFPERLEKQVNYLCQNEHIVLVGSGYYIIDSEDHRSTLMIEGSEPCEVFWKSIFGPVIMHPSAMFRKNIVNINNLRYREETFPAEDFDMWSRMMQVGECGIVQDPLIEYRLHSANISATKRDAQMARTKEIVLNNISFHFPNVYTTNQVNIGTLCDFLYCGENCKVEDVKTAVFAMGQLCKEMKIKFQMSRNQEIRIEMLASRWLIKGWLSLETSKIRSIIAMRHFAPSVARELVAFLVRRKNSKSVK